MAKREMSFIKRLGISVAVALVAIALFLVMGGILLYFTGDPMAYIDIASLALLLLAGVVSAFILTRGKSEARTRASITSHIIVAVLLFLLSLAFSGFKPELFFDYLCYLLISVLASALFGRERCRKKHSAR